METASGFELFLRSLGSGARYAVHELGSWILIWLLVASPFLWLLSRARNVRRNFTASVLVAIGFSIPIAAICAAIHYVLAFGEAFDGGIDRDRVRAFVGMTIVFVVASVCWLRVPCRGKTPDQISGP